MTKLQSLIEVLQKDEPTQGLDKLIVENFYNQENNEYVFNNIRYFILTEDEVQDLLDNQFEDELYQASEKLENKGYYQVARIVQSLDLDNNYLKAYKDAEKLNDYIFIGKTDYYYIYQE